MTLSLDMGAMRGRPLPAKGRAGPGWPREVGEDTHLPLWNSATGRSFCSARQARGATRAQG